MKYALWIAIVVNCLLVSACTQSDTTSQKCGLDLSRAPTLRGLRLGMSAEELKARYPHLEIKTSGDGKEGRLSADVRDGDQASKELDYDGLQRISLGFLDGQLSNIEFTYSGQSIRTLEADEFVNRVAGQLGLDTKGCQNSIARIHECRISCEGFEVVISPSETYISSSRLDTLPATVTLRDLVAGQKDEARQRAREAEEKGKFRP
jgi:hypothetical protein